MDLVDLADFAEGECLGHEDVLDESTLDALAIGDVAGVALGAAVSMVLATISVVVGAATALTTAERAASFAAAALAIAARVTAVDWSTAGLLGKCEGDAGDERKNGEGVHDERRRELRRFRKKCC